MFSFLVFYVFLYLIYLKIIANSHKMRYNKRKENEILDKNEIKLTPKNDVIFKRLFGQKGNEKIVKDLIEAILGEEIENVDLGYNNEILPEKIENKIGILDVKVKLSTGVWIDLEMQNIDYGDIEKRMMYYLNLMYIGELRRGKKYNIRNNKRLI